MNAHQRRIAKRKRTIKLHWYQKRVLERIRNLRVHDSIVTHYPTHFVNHDGSWLDDFQARPRGLRAAHEPLVIMPLSREITEGFEPMQGDLSKDWSVVCDEVPQPFNKENNNGQAD